MEEAELPPVWSVSDGAGGHNSVDLATIDNEKRDVAAVSIVPLNPATHHSMIRDLEAVFVVREMF